MKCIFCGEEIGFLHNEGAELHSRADFIFGACYTCEWRTLFEYDSEELAKEAIHKWFASFPPILRIQPGDKISYLSRDGRMLVNVEVLEVNKETGRIKTSGGSCVCDDIISWPW